MNKTFFSRILSGFLVAACVLYGAHAFAQNFPDTEPALPKAMEDLVNRGAQAEYLGRQHGLDGWMMIFRGQEQYFYVTAGGEAFISGLMFDPDGKPITVLQVRALQEKSGSRVLENLASSDQSNPLSGLQSLVQGQGSSNNSGSQVIKTPAERMFDDVTNSNYVVLGQEGAPVIYSFMDPTCPHCHDFVNVLRTGYLERGDVQVRMIPVSRDPSHDPIMQQASYILAVPDPENVFFSFLDGNNEVLEVDDKLNTQGVQQNLAIMQNWGMDATPFTVYKSVDGTIKIIRGVRGDIESLIADLP